MMSCYGFMTETLGPLDLSSAEVAIAEQAVKRRSLRSSALGHVPW